MVIDMRPVVFMLLVLILWQLIANLGIFNKSLFSGPLEVSESLYQLIKTGSLFSDVYASIGRLFAGLIIGSCVGVFLGLLMGRIIFLDRAISPFLNILRAFPPVAMIPLMIIWFGIGDLSKILSIAFAVFFPVWLSALIGSKEVHPDYVNTANLLSKSKTKIFLKVIVPATIPFIISGIRIGIGIAFIMLFVSELAGASSGLGYLIAYAQITYRMDTMLAGLIVLGLLSALVDYTFVMVSKKLFPWVTL